MEEANNLPLSGPSVDLNKVVALNHRRSVTFMNNFLLNTSNFLNNFSVVAEENLAKQSREMEKLEIAVNILEAKLASIPGLESVPTSNPGETKPSNSTTADKPAPANDLNTTAEPSQPTADAEIPVANDNVIKVKDDARYAKYLKMFSVGVPKVAIEGKMKAEGLDPNLLDDPNAPLPDGEQDSAADASTSSSDDDFSD